MNVFKLGIAITLGATGAHYAIQGIDRGVDKAKAYLADRDKKADKAKADGK